MGLQNRLAEQEANISNLKQTLLRVTLAKQSLESEKKELTRRVEEITEERAVEDGRKQNQQQQVDRSVYNEELRVARDAIANLRSSFSDSDPNQHILDTLEQCISVIVEKILEGGSKPGSRLSNCEMSGTGEQREKERERERKRSSCFISFSFTGYTSHQSRLLHPQIGDAFHDEHPKASGTNYPQRFQGSFRQTRILQISLQDNGQGIRHGEGGGKTMQNLLSWTIKVVTNIFEDCRG